MTSTGYFVAVIGAGPAGLFAARELATLGARVVIFNRDIKPGGLAEYGIYPDKHTMKEGLRRQFRQTLDNPNVDYYSNITIGAKGDLTLDDVRALGFQAILVTVGAQGTKWLGLPGEDLRGVYHAKDVVYHYNKLPPFSQRPFHFGKRCAIVGAGNVMMDITRHLAQRGDVDEVIAIVRRGPGEVNFTKEEMTYVIAHLDMPVFEAEMTRVLPALQAIGQDPEVGRHKILDALPKAKPAQSQTRFRFEFLTSPLRMLGANGLLTTLEVEDNTLSLRDGDVKAHGTGNRRTLNVDTIIFAIGDRVDESLGLPIDGNVFVKNPEPRFPVDAMSYEAYAPTLHVPIEGVFFGGWSRKASTGLVGHARKDGANAAKSVWQYLQTLTPSSFDPSLVSAKVKTLNKPIPTKADIKTLESVEASEAEKRNLEEFKFATNDDMLHAMGIG